MNKRTIIEWFLRGALSISFLSAVADRFGLWPQEISAWGNWEKFVEYTGTLNFFLPKNFIEPVAAFATAAEIVLGVLLLFSFKTKLVATISGFLLLTFGLMMVLAIGLKPPLDYSVFTAAAASFALSYLTTEK